MMQSTPHLLDALAHRVMRLDTTGTADPASPAPTRRASDDPQTLAQARRGQSDALAALVTDLQDAWFRYSLSLLREPDAARDATQETALRFVRGLRAFRGGSSLRTWSLGIATNVCRERRRRRTMASLPDQTQQADNAPSPGQRAVLVEQRDRLLAMLGDLPSRQREAVVLRYLEQLSVKETAQAMDCAEGTVKATLSHALRSLRERLGVDDG